MSDRKHRRDIHLMLQMAREIEQYNLRKRGGAGVPLGTEPPYTAASDTRWLLTCLNEFLWWFYPGRLRDPATCFHNPFARAAMLASSLMTFPTFRRFNNSTALHAGWVLVRAEGCVPSKNCDRASADFVSEVLGGETPLSRERAKALGRDVLDYYYALGICDAVNWLPNNREKACHCEAPGFKS